MVLSSKVSVRPGGVHGFCWFAAAPIAAGEMVWEKGTAHYNDVDVPKSTLLTWPAAERDHFMALAYQVSPGIYRGTDPSKAASISQEEANEYFVNHSCDGNCWYEGDDLLVAMKDIDEGEELVYDYALTESEPDWVLAEQCLCGKALCRGLVTGNDWKRADLQLKYGHHFTSYLLTQIREQQQQSIAAERAGAIV